MPRRLELTDLEYLTLRWTSASATSGMMIKLAQCNSHFAGKIDKRYGEGGEGRHEKDGDPGLVLNLEEGARERDDHQKSYRDTADHSPEDSSVQHHRTSHQARKIGFEPAFDDVVVGDRIQDNGSIDDPVEARDQYGNE